MANEERTEQATPRRRQDAREKGQVAKSMEVNAAVGLLAGTLAIKTFGESLVTHWRQLALNHIARASVFQINDATIRAEFLTAASGFALLILPLMAVSMVSGLVTNAVQTGFIFSSKILTPDFGRLNPWQGFARIFSQRSMIDCLKSLLKAMLVGYLAFTFVRNHATEITKLICLDFTQLGVTMSNLCWGLLLRTASVLGVLALADYLYQRWQFDKTLRMTKQELKEEFKRTEGDPLIKARIRSMQRQMARRRMMADVQKATVVLTNPTHLAVALQYDPGKMAAPLIVAKGQRLVAEKIKEIAKAHGVPVIENKPLARALFSDCEVGDTIPVELYQAIAEIIAFVFKQSGRVSGGSTNY